MKFREISRSKIGPFSLACIDPCIGIGWEYQSIFAMTQYANPSLMCGLNVFSNLCLLFMS